MSLPVIVRSDAEADIREIQATYESIQGGLGDRFVARVGEVLDRIEFMPEMYGVAWQKVRAARVKRFQHVVYYVLFDDHADVIAVMHGARDASEWQARV